ncbi:Extracellular xylan exo-alpha-(1-_2)-glucuronosidase (plasmid) [Asticcacaulis sp. MM231]|uniref:alpha-glucuronidase family glycosyl hydrolase n=1 Tax=Asticcacaulis sp. MM231 TaxID=3157666 RepID=UPI0032D59DD3
MTQRIARIVSLVLGLILGLVTMAHAEDGYDLWLRYRPLPVARAQVYSPHLTSVVAGDSPMLSAARSELQRGVSGFFGRELPAATSIGDGALVIGTPAEQPVIKALNLPLSGLGDEGYLIRSVTVDGHKVTVIAANSDRGSLYGAFRLLRHIQTGQSIDKLDIADAPKIKVRVLNHWDNLDSSVERGYAGASIWDWWRLPDLKDQRYTDYARANASVGINGTVVNNVNAKALSLTAPYIVKTAALADSLRPYGIKIYLSARFSSPMELGGLKTADPLDPAVRAWWQAKTDEIYKAIPDFGGFLVKANSEGQPGPGDYHRSHADGANMLAEALAPHGGIVMWRAFVYSEHDASDRAKQAYNEFHPLDGQFADNVLVQIKNGPIDFQPREPFSPLFGAMPKTREMMEFQITKEYTGQATHLVYLAPMFEETLKADTFAKGSGSTVARIIDGSLEKHALTGMAGVANIGANRNWTGSDFDQANWYAFGRLAWNPDASSRDIATDWVHMTFSDDPAFVTPVVDMMMNSREAMADYMTPLGLHHQMATGHHYGPGPWVHELARPEWNPVYYNKADAGGIGFDRTKTGSDALAQYNPRAAKTWSDPSKMDQRYLLWFHHLSWDYRLQDGHTLWDGLVMRYQSGVDQVGVMQTTWAGLAPYIDAQRFAAVSQNLTIQRREAQWWRDASISYFQSKSGLPLPAGYQAPALPLEAYEALTFPYAPGQGH